MNKNDKLKEIDVKNRRYYFDDIIKIEDFDLDNVLIDENWFEIILEFFIIFKRCRY